jgi:hypothetical protein
MHRVRSRRIVHFAADKLYWEYSGLDVSKEFLNSFPNSFRESFKQLLPFSRLPKIEELGPIKRGSYRV